MMNVSGNRTYIGHKNQRLLSLIVMSVVVTNGRKGALQYDNTLVYNYFMPLLWMTLCTIA